MARSEINEKTAIPLFAVLTAAPFICAVVIWIAAIDSRATAAQEKVNKLEIMLQETHDTVIRIETFLKNERRR